MALPKGRTNNPKGKPKGAKGKRTIEALKRVEYVLGLLEVTLERDMMALDPKDRVKMWETLQEYVRPKLARTELTGKDGKDLISQETNDLLTKINAKLT